MRELLSIARARDYYFQVKSDLMKCRKVTLPSDSDRVDSNIYDTEEIYPNCTVQVWTNSYTGKSSVGWWPNE